MESNIQEKYIKLKNTLTGMESVAVAFSGGVDSSLLLRAAFDALGKKAAGIFYDTVFQPSGEREMAIEIAKEIGIVLIELEGFDIQKDTFRLNPENRCYFCKKILFERILMESARLGYRTVIDGSNYDDLNDFRPGKKALLELGIRSPLQEVKLTKREIRELSRVIGLSTWDKDALSCLATRIPFNEEVNLFKLRIIDQTESILRKAGFRNVRARLLKDTVSIEVDPSQVELLSSEINKLTLWKIIQNTEYKQIIVDQAGYRQGNLNPVGYSVNKEMKT
jgi:pyridinium-3,5-biscarboxylic acid mononucleotide sulfurtransferase